MDNSDEIETSKYDEDFKIIGDEIRRQREILIGAIESCKIKAGVILGFVILILTQIILSDFISSVKQAEFSLILFFLGLLLLLIVCLLGLKLYLSSVYDMGPKISDFIKQYKEGISKNYDQAISRLIYDANSKNSKKMKKGGKIVNLMLIIFFIGFILIFISKLVLVVN